MKFIDEEVDESKKEKAGSLHKEGKVSDTSDLSKNFLKESIIEQLPAISDDGVEDIHCIDPDMHFRVSQIPRLCPRQTVLGYLRDQKTTMKIDSVLGWIFITGTGYHDLFQKYILTNLKGVEFLGHWVCKKCNAKYVRKKTKYGREFVIKKKKKKKCGNKVFYYDELSFLDKERRITGHCDGGLRWQNKEEELLELKTVSNIDWIRAKGVKYEHRVQVNYYLRYSGQSRARILYISKKEVDPDDAFVEFIVERDDSILEKFDELIDQTRKYLLEIKPIKEKYDIPLNEMNFKEFKLIPGRLSQCKNKSDYKARYCPSRQECFAI